MLIHLDYTLGLIAAPAMPALPARNIYGRQGQNQKCRTWDVAILAAITCGYTIVALSSKSNQTSNIINAS